MESNNLKLLIFFLVVFSLISAQPPLAKQNLHTAILSLKFISPNELVDNLSGQRQLDENYILKTRYGEVKLLINNSTNQILVTGDSISVLEAKNMIEFLDVAPRQIVIEAKIVELNNERIAELGADWQKFLDRTNLFAQPNLHLSHYQREYDTQRNEENLYQFQFNGQIMSSITIGDFIKIIEESGIGKITNIPKITTINNKTGILLDGSRVTYVAHYSSYANIYETSELTAGLYLEVTPSLGNNEYLRLDVKAKVTTLGEVIGGSPSEFGQQVQNTVIVKNGEEFLLGSFKKTEKMKVKRKAPILGTILPFLFSRTSEIETSKDFLVILKPMVIDLNTIMPPKIEEK
ncbi:MAG: hypothetical protein ABIL46_09235 [candidate division WOR-3 bacterium]